MSRITNAFNIKQIVPFPTRGQSKLDLVLTNLNTYYDVPQKLSPFGLSDHATIKVQPLSRHEYPKNKFAVKSRDTKPSNRLAIRKYLEEVNLEAMIDCADTCDEKTNLLETIISTGMDILTPVKTKIVITNEPRWINNELKALIRKRQQAYSRGDLDTFRPLRNRVNRMRKTCRTKYYKSKVEHLRSCNPRKWWKEVKTLGGMTPANRSDPLATFKNIDCGDINSPTNLANAINDSFLSPMNSFSPLVTEELPQVDISTLPLATEFWVLKKLSSLNPAKASGPDSIPTWLLKENADLLAPVVTKIINSSLLEAKVPSSWKHADVVPIPKQTPVLDVNKHLRPISLTPVLSKVAEEFVVEHHIKPAVMKSIDPRQFGTIPGSSTTEALISMIHTWNGGTDGNGATARVILFDFKKAFDLVDHHILVQKLRSYNFHEQTVRWIIDFLTNRKQRVKIGQNFYSEWAPVPAGVTQGTKTGPWLFIIMINDLDIPGTEIWKYVDDTTICEVVAKDKPSSIQTAVDLFAVNASKDKFQLNEGKCKELRINFSTKINDNLSAVKINGKQIDTVSHAKILGLNVSNDLKWNCHIDEITKKARSRLYCLRQLKRSGLGNNELSQFYRTCIRPITEYACPVYHNSLPAYLSEDLETIQKRAMRILQPELTYKAALTKYRLSELATRRNNITNKLYQSIANDKNHKLNKLLPETCNYKYNLRKQKKYKPTYKTNRFRDTFIIFNSI